MAEKTTNETLTRQEKLALAHKVNKRASRKGRVVLIVVLVVAFLVVVAGVLVVVQASRAKNATQGLVPANTSGTQNQAIFVGKPDAKATVILYEDFQCPACAAFEESSRDTLAAYVAAGNVKLEYRPMAFLDGSSSTRYSSRSLNAAACVVNDNPENFQKMHDLLYKSQPEEGTAGLPDDALVALAKQAGATSTAVASCITSHAYYGWTARITDQASQDNVTQTPTIRVNGTELSERSPAALTAALTAAGVPAVAAS